MKILPIPGQQLELWNSKPIFSAVMLGYAIASPNLHRCETGV